jgi:hypothetical protein
MIVRSTDRTGRPDDDRIDVGPMTPAHPPDPLAEPFPSGSLAIDQLLPVDSLSSFDAEPTAGPEPFSPPGDPDGLASALAAFEPESEIRARATALARTPGSLAGTTLAVRSRNLGADAPVALVAIAAAATALGAALLMFDPRALTGGPAAATPMVRVPEPAALPRADVTVSQPLENEAQPSATTELTTLASTDRRIPESDSSPAPAISAPVVERVADPRAPLERTPVRTEELASESTPGGSTAARVDTVAPVDRVAPGPAEAAVVDTPPAAAVAPPAAASAESAAAVVAATPLAPAPAIQSVLGRYASAFSALDAGGVRAVWPTVDERALARAFEGLEQQEFDLGTCEISVADVRAAVSCTGVARYVPKVGNKRVRSQPREWRFVLERQESDWEIRSVLTK